MKRPILCFALYVIMFYLTGWLLASAVTSPAPLWGNGTHSHGHRDFKGSDNRNYARSSASTLNVGEPRTVRMIYFLPNDRPYRADVVQRMKEEILKIQAFYAEQMEAHGYGRRTFRVETDAQGEPMVHRVDGRHPDSHYILDDTFFAIDEVWDAFDIDTNVYLIVIDNSINAIIRSGDRVGGVGSRRGKNSGRALVHGEFRFNTVAHELGHAFGLKHDFRDNTFLMSYGGKERSRLSACAAEFLSVHPYFNSDTPIEEGEPPTVELISSPLYPAGSRSIPVRLKVNDSDGLHQLYFSVETLPPHSAAGSYELKACRGLAGARETVVEFDYDGVVPSAGWSRLSNRVNHLISVNVVDKDGDNAYVSVTVEISPYYIASLGHNDVILSVAFSPDGETLASGDGNEVKLWDVATRTHIASLGHNGTIFSVAFSPDGKTLASGDGNGVKLWDVATRTHIAALGDDHTGRSVAFSPDGTTLASMGWDEIKLWDVRTRTEIAPLGDDHTTSSVAFSPDGETLASGEGNEVKLWNVATRTNFSLGYINRVRSLAFSPDGGTLASGGGDEVKLWDVATRTNFSLGYINWVHSLAFSPDGGTLALAGTRAGGNMVELWDVTMFSELVVEVEIPDPNLRAAVEAALVKPAGAPITIWDMRRLTGFSATDTNITDLTGLERATLLISLELSANAISDISAISNLTNLRYLDLQYNNISDLSPLVANTGLDGSVYVDGNPLNAASLSTHIPALQRREVAVSFDNLKPLKGDVNDDRIVDVLDLITITNNLGARVPSGSHVDVNGDGVVNALDLTLVAQEFE